MPTKPRNKLPASREKETRQAKFLAKMLTGAPVADAAAYAGVNRRTAYQWRDESPSFRSAWEETIKEKDESLLAKAEDELQERAFDRSDKNSYILLIFLLKKLNSEYKENYKREVKIQHESVREIQINPEDLKTAFSILESASERAKPKADIEAEVVSEDD